MSAGWSATATSSTRRCCAAAPAIMYEGKPVGTPDAGAFWRVCRAARGQSAVHRADRDARDQAAGPRAENCWPATTCSKFEALFLAGERCDPPTADVGRGAAAAAGGGSLVADRDRLGDHQRLPRIRLVPVPSRLGRPALPGLRSARAGRRRPRAGAAATPATSASACRCRPAARRRCGRTTRAIAAPIWRISRAGIAPAMPA